MHWNQQVWIRISGVCGGAWITVVGVLLTSQSVHKYATENMCLLARFLPLVVCVLALGGGGRGLRTTSRLQIFTNWPPTCPPQVHAGTCVQSGFKWKGKGSKGNNRILTNALCLVSHASYGDQGERRRRRPTRGIKSRQTVPHYIWFMEDYSLTSSHVWLSYIIPDV